MDKLQQHFNKILAETTSTFHRYMYEKINWTGRMIGLKGPRGVGKTTMIIQYIKENLKRDEVLYVTAEDLYFATHSLVDLADELIKHGVKHLFIDEIHKYSGWSKELKLIYDYNPELQVVFTGSSILDISDGAEADLSRRAVIYTMQGLSFREYLKLFHNIDIPQYSLQSVLLHEVIVPKGFRPLVYFGKYLQQGYYPFSLEDDFDTKLNQVITTTIENDIPQYADLNAATARKLKQMLVIISQSVPFKPNLVSIATAIGSSRNSIADYCLFLEKTQLIAQLRDHTGGIRGLEKVDKIYLDNTNLAYNLGGSATNIGNLRETLFFNQMRINHDPISSSVSDFVIEDMTFEVGGRNKKQKQIENVKNAYVVKDDIETGYMNVIPLWQLGLEY
jgi:predicted AAA+ superfamily ATPase